MEPSTCGVTLSLGTQGRPSLSLWVPMSSAVPARPHARQWDTGGGSDPIPGVTWWPGARWSCLSVINRAEARSGLGRWAGGTRSTLWVPRDRPPAASTAICVPKAGTGVQGRRRDTHVPCRSPHSHHAIARTRPRHPSLLTAVGSGDNHCLASQVGGTLAGVPGASTHGPEQQPHEQEQQEPPRGAQGPQQLHGRVWGGAGDRGHSRTFARPAARHGTSPSAP